VKRICAWCGKDMGDKPPYENDGVTHTICQKCYKEIRRESSLKPMTNDLGKMLKQRRVAIPVTLRELGAASGVSLSYLGRIERGDRFPSARTLLKIARPLGFSEGELFTLANYLPPQPEGVEKPGGGQLDPYVARVLSEEPVEVQRALVTILTMLKSVIRGNSNIGFREYIHRKYPQVDEDVITMIEDMLEHPE